MFPGKHCKQILISGSASGGTQTKAVDDNRLPSDFLALCVIYSTDMDRTPTYEYLVRKTDITPGFQAERNLKVLYSFSIATIIPQTLWLKKTRIFLSCSPGCQNFTISFTGLKSRCQKGFFLLEALGWIFHLVSEFNQLLYFSSPEFLFGYFL